MQILRVWQDLFPSQCNQKALSVKACARIMLSKVRDVPHILDPGDDVFLRCLLSKQEIGHY